MCRESFLLFRVNMTQWIALEQANITMIQEYATGTVQWYINNSNVLEARNLSYKI